MRYKKRQSNMLLLARGLEQIALEDARPSLDVKPIQSKMDGQESGSGLKTVEPVLKFKARRGPKKDALINTAKLLTG